MSNLVEKERLNIWRKILTFLLKSKEARHSTEVAKNCELTKDAAYYRLKSMAVEGLVEMVRTDYGVMLWRITDKGRGWLKQQ